MKTSDLFLFTDLTHPLSDNMHEVYVHLGSEHADELLDGISVNARSGTGSEGKY
jgi:hypothetical protein